MSQARILVVGEGTPDFWQEIALGFEAFGCEVAYATLSPGLPGELVATGRRFDLLVTNQQGVNRFALAVRDGRSIDWKAHFQRILMVQYHDVVREIPTLTQARIIFEWNAIRLSYLSYCRATLDFLRETGFYGDVVLTGLPLNLDRRLEPLQAGRAGLIDDIRPLIVERRPPGDDRLCMASAPRIIYLASCWTGNSVLLRDEGTIRTVGDFKDVVKDYLNQGDPLDRLGFVRRLMERGLVTSREIQNSIAAEYLCNYANMVVQAIRRDQVAMLKARFGGEFDLYGKGWDRLGIDAIPIDNAADETKYRSAGVSIDFGSQFVDVSLYQRTMQILTSGGRLLQLAQPDRREAFGAFADLVCFHGADALLDRLAYAQDAAEEFAGRHAAFIRRLGERNAPAAVLGPVARHVGLEAAAAQA